MRKLTSLEIISLVIIVLATIAIITLSNEIYTESSDDCLMGCALGSNYDDETGLFNKIYLQNETQLNQLIRCDKICEIYLDEVK